MKSLTWVHLSDIHFFSDKRPRFEQHIVVRALARDICTVAQKIGTPDLIFLTGDIAFSADSTQEYPTAREWLDKLLAELGGLPASRVLIVPGNHDVDRAHAKETPLRRNQRDQIRAKKEQSGQALDEHLADKDSREQLWGKFKAFAEFSKSYGNIQLDAAHPLSVWAGSPLPDNTQVVGLNTALLSYDDEDRIHRLALGDRQLDATHQVPDEHLLLVLMHHPPEELHDGGKLLAILADRPALLFTGHMHQLRAVQSETLGTSGHLNFQAGAGYGEHAGEHRYAWGRLDSRGLRYYPRRIDRDTTRFINDTRPSRITKRLSPELGDYYHQALSKLPSRLQDWIKKQNSEASTPRTETQPAILIDRTQVLEEHLFGDSVERLLSERLDHLNQLRRQRAFSEAKTVLSQLTADVAARLAAARAGEHVLRMQQWSYRCQVTSASIHLEENQPDIAQEECRAIYSAYEKNPACLRHKTRIGLANLLMAFNQTEEALKLLPSDSEEATWDEEGRQTAALIRKAIEIKQGQFPEEYGDVELKLIAAQKLLESGDVTRAIRLAREVVELTGEAEASRPARDNALHVLLLALHAVIWDVGTLKQGLPFPERRWILEIVGKYVEQQATATLDLWGRRLAIGYYRLTEQAAKGIELLNAVESDAALMHGQSPPIGWVQEFAAIMQAALGSGRGSDHISVVCDRLQQLAIRYPRRAPIEFELARYLISLGRYEDALPHARSAFLTLPGIGQRLQLAQCFLVTRRFQRAIDLVASFPESQPDVLQIRAKAMAFLPKYMAAAVPLLNRHLEQYPNDGGAWLGLAQAQARLGHPEEAADAAWRARETLSEDELQPDILVECAQLQLGSQQSARTRTRVEETLAVLLERFPSDPDAARGRLALLHRLGFPSDHPIDFTSLIELGAVWQISAAQGLAMLRDGVVRAQHLHNLYQRGFLPFEALCELTNTPAPRYLTQALKSRPPKGGQLCPPITYTRVLPSERLRNAHLVCGALEVILLLHLGLFEALKKTLGQEGRLILFEDVLERVQGDGLRLLRDTPPQPSVAGGDDALLGIEERRLVVELQRTLEDGQRARFIEFIPRPRMLAELPSVRPQENEDLYEAWVRNPLANSSAYHRAVSEHPQRLLLSADLLTAEPCAPAVMIARAMKWQTPEQFFLFRRQTDPERVLGFPALLRSLWASNYTAQEELLALGFQDALDPRLLFHMYQKYRGLDQPRPRDCLDNIEWRAVQPGHVGLADARTQLSWSYAATVWAAFCAPPGPQESRSVGNEAIANAILQRCEKLDGSIPPPILLSTLEQIAFLSIQMPGPSIQESDSGFQITSDSPAGQMWRFLSLWAGPEGVRREALGLALAQAWLLLDRKQDSAAEIRALVLYVAVRSVQARPQSLSTVAPEVEAVAILSAHWEVKPLEDLQFEAVLQAAARDLAQYTERPLAIPWDERSYHLAIPEHSSTLSLPAEAVLLRASDDVISWAAPVLAVRQGLHDARAYDLLMKISVAPSRIDLRRKYARLAIGAPWRQVRNSPSSMGAWTPWRIPQRFPRNLNDLRRMLCETPLDERKTSIVDVLVHRTTWQDLPHGRYALQLACEIPGSLPLISSQVRRDARAFSDEISLALERLTQPNEQSAGRLCSEIIFLCRAVEHQETVDLSSGPVNLREAIPRRFAGALAAVLSSQPNIGGEPRTLAEAEFALLRLCSRKISELSGLTNIPMREGLWLCYRLYQWLVLQMDRLQPTERNHALKVLSRLAPIEEVRTDLLHPLHCARGKIDLRVMAVLQGLYLGVQLARSQRQPASYLPLVLELETLPNSIPWDPTSPALERLLIDIASRDLTEAERSMRPLELSPSCLDWNGPGTAPDLALTLLLILTHGRGWLRLPHEVRLKWIAQIPMNLQEKDGVNRGLALLIIDALGDLCRSASSDERATMLSRLRAMEVSAEISHWRLTYYSALFAAGHGEFHEEVDTLLRSHLEHPSCPAFFGRYLVGLSLTADNKHIEDKVHEILGLVSPEQSSALLWGVGYLVLHGASSAKAAADLLLRQLAASPPWLDDPRTSRLLALVAAESTRAVSTSK